MKKLLVIMLVLLAAFSVFAQGATEAPAAEPAKESHIPTGTPLVYELGDDFKAISHRYLGDQSAIEAKMKAVANQGAKKAN